VKKPINTGSASKYPTNEKMPRTKQITAAISRLRGVLEVFRGAGLRVELPAEPCDDEEVLLPVLLLLLVCEVVFFLGATIAPFKF